MEKAQDEFLGSFLLQFTKELIRNSSDKIAELENILKREEKARKREIVLKIKEIEKPAEKKVSAHLQFYPKIPQRISASSFMPLPAQKKPYSIRPYPTETEIELGKLNPLIKNPAVKIIECNGPDEALTIKGATGTKNLDMTLTKDEINRIIETFSHVAKIPVQEGIFKVVVGKLILSAIVSNVIGSKFIITKITYYPELYGVPRPTQAR